MKEEHILAFQGTQVEQGKQPTRSGAWGNIENKINSLRTQMQGRV